MTRKFIYLQNNINGETCAVDRDEIVVVRTVQSPIAKTEFATEVVLRHGQTYLVREDVVDVMLRIEDDD